MHGLNEDGTHGPHHATDEGIELRPGRRSISHVVIPPPRDDVQAAFGAKPGAYVSAGELAKIIRSLPATLEDREALADSLEALERACAV